VATGNTFGATTWNDGEAVIRLSTDLHRSTDKRDFFAPPNWRALDQRDADLGGTNPIPLNVQSPNGPQALLLALGKDGNAYVLDRNNLGGIGGSLLTETVSSGPIRTAPATYPVGGDAFVAFQGPGAHCPQTARSTELTVLKIGPGTPPTMGTVGVELFAARARQSSRQLMDNRIRSYGSWAPRATAGCTASEATRAKFFSPEAGPRKR